MIVVKKPIILHTHTPSSEGVLFEEESVLNNSELSYNLTHRDQCRGAMYSARLMPRTHGTHSLVHLGVASRDAVDITHATCNEMLDPCKLEHLFEKPGTFSPFTEPLINGSGQPGQE